MSFKKPANIILGTHLIGDPSINPMVSIDTLEDAQTVFDTFYSRGYRDIDTSRNYVTAEERLGETGASRFTITTKVWSLMPGDHEPEKVAKSIQQSLDALKVSSVEGMLLHVSDRHTPFEVTAKAINDAYLQGKFKKFGLSSYTPEEVKQFLDICEANGYVKPSLYEGHYNAIVRGSEKDLFPLLREHNIAFLAFSPGAGGLFSGHTDLSDRWVGSSPPAKLYRKLYGKPPIQASVAKVLDAVEKHGINGHEAAIRWAVYHSTLDGSHGDGVIIGLSKVEQLSRTLDAIDAGPLPADVVDAITAVYATVEGSEPPRYHHLSGNIEDPYKYE